MDTRDAPQRLRALPSWLLVQAAARAARLVTARTSSLGVSKPLYPALAILEASGPASQAELGRRLGMDRKDVSGLAADLEMRGVVTRRTDQGDRRRNHLEITPGGLRLLRDLDDEFAAAQDEIFAGLSGQERELLASLLARVVDTD